MTNTNNNRHAHDNGDISQIRKAIRDHTWVLFFFFFFYTKSKKGNEGRWWVQRTGVEVLGKNEGTQTRRICSIREEIPKTHYSGPDTRKLRYPVDRKTCDVWESIIGHLKKGYSVQLDEQLQCPVLINKDKLIPGKCSMGEYVWLFCWAWDWG